MKPLARADGPTPIRPAIEVGPSGGAPGAGEHLSWVIDGGRAAANSLSLPREEPVTLTLNGQELVTLLASPGHRSELAIGFLYDEGIVDRLDQLVSVEEDESGVRVEAAGVDLGRRLFERRVLSSGCGKGMGFSSALDVFAAPWRKLPQELPWVGASAVAEAARVTYSMGPLYQRTQGTHAAGLFDREGGLVAIGEDIGRHNAVDKVVGRLLVAGVPLAGLFMVVTGRISSEMVSKVAKTPIPLLVSKSVATSLAIEHAERLSLGLVGMVRRSRLVAFTYPELVDPAG
jgi:FdhD protein